MKNIIGVSIRVTSNLDYFRKYGPPVGVQLVGRAGLFTALGTVAECGASVGHVRVKPPLWARWVWCAW